MPAATSLSSAASSAAPSLAAIATSSVKPNCRPMTAAICAPRAPRRGGRAGPSINPSASPAPPRCPRPPIPPRSWSIPRRRVARHRSWPRSPRPFPACKPCAAATLATSRAHSARLAIQRQKGGLRTREPGWREIRPRAHEGKQVRVAKAVGQARHQFEHRGIDPVRVLQHQQDRIALAQTDDLVDKQRDGRRLALRRSERQLRERVRVLLEIVPAQPLAKFAHAVKFLGRAGAPAPRNTSEGAHRLARREPRLASFAVIPATCRAAANDRRRSPRRRSRQWRRRPGRTPACRFGSRSCR